MKAYKAYTQEGYGAEVFDITENGEQVVVYADSIEEAEDLFIAHIYSTSLYDDETTHEWLERNNLYVYESGEEEWM